jgi:hypothetical protein
MNSRLKCGRTVLIFLLAKSILLPGPRNLHHVLPGTAKVSFNNDGLVECKVRSLAHTAEPSEVAFLESPRPVQVGRARVMKLSN